MKTDFQKLIEPMIERLATERIKVCEMAVLELISKGSEIDHLCWVNHETLWDRVRSVGYRFVMKENFTDEKCEVSIVGEPINELPKQI